jgi:hypothetical protein
MSKINGKIGPYTCLDRNGWPVVTIKGRPVLNLLRLLIHTRKIKRWAPPVFPPDPAVTSQRKQWEATDGE